MKVTRLMGEIGQTREIRQMGERKPKQVTKSQMRETGQMGEIRPQQVTKMNEGKFGLKKWAAIAVICSLFLTAFYFTACQDQSEIGGEESRGGKEILVSQTINIPMEKVKTLNPIISSDEDVFFMSKLLYRSLFVLGDNLIIENDLVDQHEYLPDGSLSLTVKNDVFWEDGNKLTVDDVKFTIDAILALSQSSGSLYLDSAAVLKSCKIDKEGNVIIAFVGGTGGDRSLENLLFPIMPAHKYNRAGDLLKADRKFVPMGTGSYQIDEYEDGEFISLVGSSDYKGELPKNNLVFTFLRNKEDAINLFGTGEVNLSLLRQIDRGTLVASDQIQTHSFVSNELEFLIFNQKSEKLADSGVRRAIADGVDREAIVQNCYFQSGVVNNSLYYPAYLEDADWKLASTRTHYNPVNSLNKLSLNLIYNQENNSRKIAAELIQNQLEEVGTKVFIKSLSQEEYLQALQKGDYDIAIGGAKLNRKYDLTPLLHSQGNLNFASYSNPEMDLLLNKLKSGLDLEAKRGVYSQIQEIYQEDMPYLCLLYKTYGLALTKGTAGNIEPTFDNIYKGIENWQINYEVEQGS